MDRKSFLHAYKSFMHAHELPSRWKVQVLDAGVDDISVDDIICRPMEENFSTQTVRIEALGAYTHLYIVKFSRMP